MVKEFEVQELLEVEVGLVKEAKLAEWQVMEVVLETEQEGLVKLEEGVMKVVRVGEQEQALVIEVVVVTEIELAMEEEKV